MNYKDYKNTRDLVWEILIRERVTELPVRVSELCRNMGIPILLHEFEDGNSGISAMVNGGPIILVNKGDSAERQRFTAAHVDKM